MGQLVNIIINSYALRAVNKLVDRNRYEFFLSRSAVGKLSWFAF